MKIFAQFPSKYLKAADLREKHIELHMTHVALEELETKEGRELKPILYFKEAPKGMVLNKTNALVISGLYGDETDVWKGMPIVLFSAMVAFGADTVDAIRMKAPSQASRIRAMKGTPHEEALTERMYEDRLNYRGETKPALEPTPENLKLARERWEKGPIRTPKPRPATEIWDEDEVRPATEAEKAEAEREELSNSMLRANAALETRQVLRGASDGLDIPTIFRRTKEQPPVAAQ